MNIHALTPVYYFVLPESQFLRKRDLMAIRTQCPFDHQYFTDPNLSFLPDFLVTLHKFIHLIDLEFINQINVKHL